MSVPWDLGILLQQKLARDPGSVVEKALDVRQLLLGFMAADQVAYSEFQEAVQGCALT